MTRHVVTVERHPTLLGPDAISAVCECGWRSNWFDVERIAQGFGDQHLRTTEGAARRAELKRKEMS